MNERSIHSRSVKNARRIGTTKIVTIYIVFGMLWIYGSDTAVAWLIRDPDLITRLSVGKGSFFILCTATLLYFLINRLAKKISAAEKEQHESLKNYQTIFNATNEAIAIIDFAEEKIVEVNKQMLEMFDCVQEEMNARDVTQLFTYNEHLSKEKLKRFIIDATEGTPQLFEWLSHRKNGLQFWVEISLKKATITGRDRLIAVIRDNTGRKKAEQALLESERKWRVVFERSPIGIVILNQDTIIQDCNQHFADIFEVKREKYLQLNIAEHLTNIEVRQNFLEARNIDTPLTYEGPYTSIFSAKHLYLNITTEKIADDLIIAIFIDMTGKRETELSHERLQAQLYQAQKM